MGGAHSSPGVAGRLGELVQDEGRQDLQVGGAGVAWEGRVARCSGEDRGGT